MRSVQAFHGQVFIFIFLIQLKLHKSKWTHFNRNNSYLQNQLYNKIYEMFLHFVLPSSAPSISSLIMYFLGFLFAFSSFSFLFPEGSSSPSLVRFFALKKLWALSSPDPSSLSNEQVLACSSWAPPCMGFEWQPSSWAPCLPHGFRQALGYWCSAPHRLCRGASSVPAKAALTSWSQECVGQGAEPRQTCSQ